MLYLRSFVNGTQGDMKPIAESLFSAGLLSNGGFDGGSAVGNDGGTVFYINEYGELLVKYGLDDG